jgi:prepilin-type N-terminal cleavage/methylation domain-containing protein
MTARTPRRGFSLLEFQVALVVFGIALAGLFPLVVMHSRGLESLEKKSAAAGQWYLAPSPDAWARKLGAAAALVREDPGPLPAAPGPAENEVQILSFERSLAGDEATVHTSVNSLPAKK